MNRCSIIACARWEETAIFEWLAYHAAIGFDHVYLYCNDDDPTAFIAEVARFAQTRQGFVSLTHFPGQGQQRAMYLDAAPTAIAQSEWVTFLDVDEFLVLRGVDDVNVFLASLPQEVDSVHFHWLNFGTSGHKQRPAAPVLPTYTRRTARLHPNTKHLTRTARLDPARLASSGYPFWHALADPTWADLHRVDALGAPFSPGRPPQSPDEALIARAVVNHYMFKSEQDFERRAARGLGGEFSGQAMWQREYEKRTHSAILASLDEIEDRYLADFSAARLGATYPTEPVSPMHATSDSEPSHPIRTVAARHRHWSDNLLLGANGRLRHASHGSRGRYIEAGEVLAVQWDEWPADLFWRQGDGYVAANLAETSLAEPRPIDLATPQRARAGQWDVPVAAIAVQVPGTELTVELRCASSDGAVFGSVFMAREYAIDAIPEPVELVVDAGANTGMSALFFAQRYPAARIVALEPELSNFQLLRRNTRQVPRIQPVHAAIWSQDTTLSIDMTDAAGRAVDAWGFQTKEAASAGTTQQVEAVSMASLIDRFGIERIDLLKVDIEGAECELFSGSLPWLAITRAVLVETHDRFREGSDAAVTAALAAEFEELPMSGENRVFIRRGAAGQIRPAKP